MTTIKYIADCFRETKTLESRKNSLKMHEERLKKLGELSSYICGKVLKECDLRWGSSVIFLKGQVSGKHLGGITQVFRSWMRWIFPLYFLRIWKYTENTLLMLHRLENTLLMLHRLPITHIAPEISTLLKICSGAPLTWEWQQHEALTK